LLTAARERGLAADLVASLSVGLEQGLAPREVIDFLRPHGLDSTVADQLVADVGPIPTPGGRLDGFAQPTQVGPYRIVDEISRGGVGVVFRAVHETLQRPVAIKLLRAGREADPRTLERFATEARAVARLRHPHVISVHEVGQHALGPYLVMDLIEGESLGQRIRRQGALEPGVAARIAQRVADALAYAHGKGVLHRDVKPDNVLLDLDDNPVLTDFGLARELDVDASNTRLTREGQLVGTPAYTPPEQLLGKTELIDARADVYALGATLYEMLTGDLPFPHTDTWALARAIVSDPPPPPSSKAPGIARDLDVICLECLEKDPQHRYPSAEALEIDLQRHLSDLPILASPPGRGERLQKWARRNSGLAVGLLASGSLCVFGLSVGSALFIDQARSERDAAERARAEAQRERDEAQQARDAAVAARIEAGRAQQAADEANAELSLEHAAAQEQLARANLLVGHALEQKALRAYEAHDWGSAAAFYAAALAREATPRRRARLGAALDRAWGRRLLPGSEGARAWSWGPEGRRLAAASADGPLHVWDADGVRLASLEAAGVRCVAWSPDGERLAVGGDGGELWIWIPGSEVAKHTVQAHDRVLDVHWVDSTRVATRGRDGVLALWGYDGSALQRRDLELPRLPDRVPDWGRWGWREGVAAVVVTRTSRLLCWDPGPDALTSLRPSLAGRSWGLAALPCGLVAHSSRGAWVVPAEGERLRELVAPSPLAFDRPSLGVGADPSGRWVANAQQGVLRVWDLSLETPTPRELWPGHPVTSLAWSPSGGRLAATDGSTLRLWSHELKPGASVQAGPGGLSDLRWDPRGRWLLAREREQVVVWRPGASEPAIRLPVGMTQAHELRWAPGGGALAICGSAGVEVWSPPPVPEHSGQLARGDFSSWSGEALWLSTSLQVAALGVRGGLPHLAVWSALNGSLERSLPVEGTRLGLSADRAVLSVQGAAVELYDTQTWRALGRFPARASSPVQWSPAAPQLAHLGEGGVHVRDGQGRLAGEFAVARPGEALGDPLAWSASGRFLAGSSRRGGEGGLWVVDLSSGEVRHGAPSRPGLHDVQLAWSEDERHLATVVAAPDTTTLTLWRAADLEPLHTWSARLGVRRVVWAHGSLRWHDGRELLRIDPSRPDAPGRIPCAPAWDVSPIRDELATIHDGWLQIRAGDSGELLYEQPESAHRVRWSLLGKRVLLYGSGKHPPRLVRVPWAKGQPAELQRQVSERFGLRVVDLELVEGR